MLESESNSCTYIYFANHSSSQLDPDFITLYIADEQAIGHYSAAFLPEDLEQLIGPFRTSPIGLVLKPHTDIFRMIQDLSYPRNLARVVPWRNRHGEIRPMVKTRAINHINAVLKTWGWGTAFGHSFRIGGASFYLSQKVDPEMVRIAGRWCSLAYEAYVHAFEHLSNPT
jgi:hypothetical protein